MDRVVHHGVKYGVAISLSSTRITKYESINGANEYGWYQGDGMIYIYTDGYDYGFHHFWYADPYLQPGTTVNLAHRTGKNIHPMIFNSDPFAGGVEHGKYGAAGFILGYPESAYKISGSNTFESLEATKITAKKSYFMFDNEIVCIGSDINDYSGKDVITVVENRLWGLNWGKDGWDFSKTDLYIDGELINAPATAQTTISARTMYFENMGGYLFLDQNSAQLSYRKSTRRVHPTVTADDGTSFDFLEITLNHGKGNGNVKGKYAYLYLPEATPEQTEAYADNLDVDLICRTNSAHAVLETKLGILGCMFFDMESFEVNNEATDVKKVSAETPCALMISKNEAGEYVISVSDPTQTYQTVAFEIEIESISTVVSSSERIHVERDGDVLTVLFNAKGSRGETFNFTVK
jgi:hyaluronate lyase